MLFGGADGPTAVGPLRETEGAAILDVRLF